VHDDLAALLWLARSACASLSLQGVPFPEARVRALFQQLITAVDYSHRLGIVSRDVKLDNMLLIRCLWLVDLVYEPNGLVYVNCA
jgi:serine/threonine protein kinase